MIQLRTPLLILGFATSISVFASEPPAPVDSAFTRFRLGGYGEMLAQFKDYGLNRYSGVPTGNMKVHHNEISIPRFILAGDYKITNKWILGAEIEFEAGGTGQALEIESGSASENGEYELEHEKGGEVVLEQFHLTHLITPAFNIRAGHMILPIGLTNTYHEPINFFTAARPEGATTLLPSTWHETGLAFFGQFGKHRASFDYEAMVTAGLNPNGFNVYHWIKGGKQGLFETDNFTAPAYTLRLNWTGLPGLRLGASLFYNPNAGKNADKLITYSSLGKINILLYSFDATYTSKYMTARANFFSGNMPETRALTSANRSLGMGQPYSTPKPGYYIAQRAVDWSLEAGLNLKALFPGTHHFPTLYPFFHYNYYNPQQKIADEGVAENRCQVSLWSVGLNWRILPGLIAKADYTTRQIGTNKIFGKGKYNSENEFRIALTYTLWFTK